MFGDVSSARGPHGVAVAAGVVAADQVSKLAAAHSRAGALRNPAYALGVVRGPEVVLVLGALAVLAAFVLVVDNLARRCGLSAFLPALIVGGIAGNTIDRVLLGSVRDFLVTPWVIVNFADVAVALGVAGLACSLALYAPRLRAGLAPAAAAR